MWRLVILRGFCHWPLWGRSNYCSPKEKSSEANAVCFISWGLLTWLNHISNTFWLHNFGWDIPSFIVFVLYHYRRKFRSLTSDNMDSWKSRAEQQSQKMKKQSREVESEERRYNCAKVSRKKIHRREMLGKSRNAVFFNDLWVGWVEK